MNVDHARWLSRWARSADSQTHSLALSPLTHCAFSPEKRLSSRAPANVDTVSLDRVLDMSQPTISILGGGVSGITTGIVVALLGGRPHLYTARRADHAMGGHHPQMASLYPAASVLPHRVTVDDVAAHMRDTQACFEVLRQSGTCGVRTQRHYELFESDAAPEPAYLSTLQHVERISANGTSPPDAPCRPNASSLSGWRCRIYVAETPTYLPRLYALYRALGGIVHAVHLTRAALPDLPGAAFVNALGVGSRDVFPDDRPAQFLRGCLVYAPPQPTARFPGASVPLASYNYTPTPDVYPTHAGSPGGLYFYPRLDAWVLGGSARPGQCTNAGEWTGPPPKAPTTVVDGHRLPRAVVDVNASILAAWTGVDVRSQPLRATYGIRYVRDPDDEGLCLAPDTVDGRLLVHNHGHGGAGVTLSWSSALRVARHLCTQEVLSTGVSSLPSMQPEADRVLLASLQAMVRHRLSLEK